MADFKKLLFGREKSGKYTPLPGHRALCQHGKLGIVTDIQVEGGRLLFVGHQLHDTSKDWQSVNPQPPSR
jgi:hypothetical protein